MPGCGERRSHEELVAAGGRFGPRWAACRIRSGSVQVVKVPIPVACRLEVPARPAMPTEALATSVDLDRFTALALAEIELREGYKGELRAALAECVRPVRHPA